MKSAIALSAVAIASASVSYPMYEGLTYDSYLRDFKEVKEQNTLLANPQTIDELLQRKAIFDINLETIRKHNSQGHSWWMEVNQFADMLPSEIEKSFTGRTTSSHGGVKSAPNLGNMMSAPSSTNYNRINWVDNGIVSSTLNQGSCGSCWAFSAAQVITPALIIEYMKQTGRFPPPDVFKISTQQATSCTPNPRRCGGEGGCKGATAQLAFDYLQDAGLVSDFDYPYTSGTTRQTGDCDANLVNKSKKVGYVTGHTNVKMNDVDALIEALLKGPVSVSANGSLMSFYGGGVFTGCQEKNEYTDNHALTLVGTGFDEATQKYYYLVQNSWSNTWGSTPACLSTSQNPVCKEKGFIKMYRSPPGVPEKCGWNTRPMDGAACEDDAPEKIWACGECGLFQDSSYAHVALNATSII